MAQGRQLADARRRRGDLIGNTVASLAQVPGDIYAQRLQEKAQQVAAERQQTQDARIQKQDERADVTFENQTEDRKAERAKQDAAQVVASGYAPDVVAHVLDTWEKDGIITPEEGAQLNERISTPEGRKHTFDFIAQIKPVAPKAPEPFELSEGQTAFNADGTIRATVPKPEPEVKPDTRSLQVQAADAFKANDMEGYKRILGIIKDTGDAGRGPQQGTGAAGGSVEFTPDDIEYLGTQYRVLGTQGIPTRIGENDRKMIIHAATEQTKRLGQSPASAVQRQAAFKSDASALTKMNTMASSAEAFEEKANTQADLIASLSQKVDRTQWPIVNKAILSGKENIQGNTDAHLFENALLTFTTEYAKLMEGSTGSAAGSSEGARRDAAKLISTALNKGTIDQTVKQMQWEMAQTRRGYDVVIGHITERMGGTPAAVPAATLPEGNISVTAPDGSKHPFATQAQADAFKKLAGIK